MEFSISAYLLGLVPVVTGVVQIFKPFVSDDRYYPVMSLFFGVAGAFLFKGDMSIGVTVVSGIVISLSASGLYSGGKAIVANK